MRSPIVAIPLRYLPLMPRNPSLGGWIAAAGMAMNSRAASTSRPAVRPSWRTTSSRVRKSQAIRGKPNLARRFIAGTISPRENTTPSMTSVALGTGVMCSTISTCATCWLASAYAVSATLNTM